MEKLTRIESSGHEIGIGIIHKILNPQIKRAFPKLPWATEENYLEINNTTDIKIIRDTKTGILRIIHQKEGEKIEIPTPLSDIEKYGIISIQGKDCYFAVALLLRFHGEPCERQSKKLGGSGYDRF